MSTTGRPVEDSYCVPKDSVLLEGRCRDFTALRASEKLTVGTPNDVSTKVFRFILLEYMSAPSSGSSITNSVTIKVNSMADLDLNSTGGLQTIAKSEVYCVQNLVIFLKKYGINAVFCSDSIIDDLVYLTAAAGITVVSLSTSFLPLYSFPFSLTTFIFLSLLLFFLVFFSSCYLSSVPFDSLLQTVTQSAD